MDEETVMMHSESGKYYSLNPVATKIWEMLENPIDFETIVLDLMKEFDVSLETCRKESREFLQKLLDEEMVEIIK